MKKLSKVIDVILYIIVAISITSALSSAIWKKPMLLTSVRSNSMYPLFERSDMLVIKSISHKNSVNIGDIVVFKVEEGSLSDKGWIVHRIVAGDNENGYITKGDANDASDQDSGGTGPIQREWIVSKVITIGNQPVKIPLLGYLPLWMEQFQTNPYTMPAIAIILAFIVGISELGGGKKNKNKKKKNKKSGLELQLIYFFCGLTISVIMCASMLATSQNIIVPYEVAESGQGVIMGSDIGAIKVGDEINKPLSKLENKGFFPIIGAITTTDPQISFSDSLITLKPGNSLEIEMTLKASNVGKYNPTIHVGMFYPFLPSKVIYYLCTKSYWLALAVISFIPGLPLMLYPLIDKNLRYKTIKEIRRFARRIRRYIPINN